MLRAGPPAGHLTAYCCGLVDQHQQRVVPIAVPDRLAVTAGLDRLTTAMSEAVYRFCPEDTPPVPPAE